ncbi:MAG: hypothetical protein ACRDHE_14380 [Ktedonobacterales bacterium]
MTAPLVPAMRIGPMGREQLCIECCPYCGRAHYHGAGNGHRVAHCIGEHGQDAGYVLREVAAARDALDVRAEAAEAGR